MFKHLLKKILKVVLFSLFTFLIIAILFIIYVAYDVYKTGFSTEKTDIKYYNFAINNCRDTEGCKHFPKKYTENLSNAEFYYYDSGLGGQTILLYLKTDKKNIESEIKKSIYHSLTNDGVSFIFSHARGNRQHINIDSYTSFYGLNRKPSEIDINKKHYIIKGFGGIAVNKDLTQILYYHVNPEG